MGGRAHDGTEVVRVGHPIEQQHAGWRIGRQRGQPVAQGLTRQLFDHQTDPFVMGRVGDFVHLVVGDDVVGLLGGGQGFHQWAEFGAGSGFGEISADHQIGVMLVEQGTGIDPVDLALVTGQATRLDRHCRLNGLLGIQLHGTGFGPRAAIVTGLQIAARRPWAFEPLPLRALAARLIVAIATTFATLSLRAALGFGAGTAPRVLAVAITLTAAHRAARLATVTAWATIATGTTRPTIAARAAGTAFAATGAAVAALISAWARATIATGATRAAITARTTGRAFTTGAARATVAAGTTAGTLTTGATRAAIAAWATGRTLTTGAAWAAVTAATTALTLRFVEVQTKVGLALTPVVTTTSAAPTPIVVVAVTAFALLVTLFETDA